MPRRGPGPAFALAALGLLLGLAAAAAGRGRGREFYDEVVLLPEDAAVAQAAAAALRVCPAGKQLKVDVTVELDRSYVREIGSAARAVREAQSVLKEVRRVYLDQLGVRLDFEVEVAGRRGHNYGTREAREMLDRVRSRWGGDFLLQLRRRGAVIVLTGKRFEGNTIGIAFQDSACGSSSYALVHGTHHTSRDCQASLIAHEIAHMLHVHHRQRTNGDRSQRHVMEPSPGCSMQFSKKSVQESRQGVSAALGRGNPACTCRAVTARAPGEPSGGGPGSEPPPETGGQDPILECAGAPGPAACKARAELGCKFFPNNSGGRCLAVWGSPGFEPAACASFSGVGRKAKRRCGRLGCRWEPEAAASRRRKPRGICAAPE